MIPFDKARELTHGTQLYHITQRNADGTPVRWRVNGAVKLWKTRPTEIEIPIKHGMKDYDYVRANTLGLMCLDEHDAYIQGLRAKVNRDVFGDHNRNVDLCVDVRTTPSSDHDWGNFREYITSLRGNKITKQECDILLDIHTTMSKS